MNVLSVPVRRQQPHFFISGRPTVPESRVTVLQTAALRGGVGWSGDSQQPWVRNSAKDETVETVQLLRSIYVVQFCCLRCLAATTLPSIWQWYIYIYIYISRHNNCKRPNDTDCGLGCTCPITTLWLPSLFRYGRPGVPTSHDFRLQIYVKVIGKKNKHPNYCPTSVRVTSLISLRMTSIWTLVKGTGRVVCPWALLMSEMNIACILMTCCSGRFTILPVSQTVQQTFLRSCQCHRLFSEPFYDPANVTDCSGNLFTILPVLQTVQQTFLRSCQCYRLYSKPSYYPANVTDCSANLFTILSVSQTVQQTEGSFWNLQTLSVQEKLL